MGSPFDSGRSYHKSQHWSKQNDTATTRRGSPRTSGMLHCPRGPTRTRHQLAKLAILPGSNPGEGACNHWSLIWSAIRKPETKQNRSPTCMRTNDDEFVICDGCEKVMDRVPNEVMPNSIFLHTTNGIQAEFVFHDQACMIAKLATMTQDDFNQDNDCIRLGVATCTRPGCGNTTPIDIEYHIPITWYEISAERQLGPEEWTEDHWYTCSLPCLKAVAQLPIEARGPPWDDKALMQKATAISMAASAELQAMRS